VHANKVLGEETPAHITAMEGEIQMKNYFFLIGKHTLLLADFKVCSVYAKRV
jgi:hypothetical protein